jgi:FecR protein
MVGRARASRAVVAALIALGVVAGIAIPVSAAASTDASTRAGGGGGTQNIATIEVTRDSVEVRKEGGATFRAARDGEKLDVGDRVRTDATGRAELKYADDSYTRLDVNTTFTVTKLSDDQGNRQVEGTLDSGQTWNRTAELTGTQSFQQSGAGATASVLGTAFAVQCDLPTTCAFTGVVDEISLTGANVVRDLQPLQRVVVDASALGDTSTLTLEEISNNAWIQENLRLDLELGFGPGPFVFPPRVTGSALPLGPPLIPAPNYPPDSCSFGMSFSSGPSGSQPVVTIGSATGPFLPGATVQLDFLSDTVPLGTVTADAAGHVSTRITIPAGASLGAHTVRATGPGVDGSTTCPATFTVTAAGASQAGSGPLAFTGSSNTPELVGLALVALIAGIVLVVGARRRAALRSRISGR